MVDIVKRLRSGMYMRQTDGSWSKVDLPSSIMLEAADEIDRLRDALQQIIDINDGDIVKCLEKADTIACETLAGVQR